MTQIDSDAALLAITLVGRDGKRRHDSQSKRRLVEACPQPGVSVAGLALEAGVNANLLRRWIKELDVRALIPAPLASVLRGQ
jgi:transposase